MEYHVQVQLKPRGHWKTCSRYIRESEGLIKASAIYSNREEAEARLAEEEESDDRNWHIPYPNMPPMRHRIIEVEVKVKAEEEVETEEEAETGLVFEEPSDSSEADRLRKARGEEPDFVIEQWQNGTFIQGIHLPGLDQAFPHSFHYPPKDGVCSPPTNATRFRYCLTAIRQKNLIVEADNLVYGGSSPFEYRVTRWRGYGCPDGYFLRLTGEIDGAEVDRLAPGHYRSLMEAHRGARAINRDSSHALSAFPIRADSSSLPLPAEG